MSRSYRRASVYGALLNTLQRQRELLIRQLAAVNEAIERIESYRDRLDIDRRMAFLQGYREQERQLQESEEK